MAKGTSAEGRTKSGQMRLERQKAALKANMGRRKAQARARNAQGGEIAPAEQGGDLAKTKENEGKGPTNRGE
jgi:hypothetical protein